jgi:hypothetical protein
MLKLSVKYNRHVLMNERVQIYTNSINEESVQIKPMDIFKGEIHTLAL